MNTATATSPAKVILFGEHAVVHGFPAIVATLGLSTQVTAISNEKGTHQHPPFIQNVLAIFQKKYGLSSDQIALHIHSQIPIGCCLGSSAATACAIFKSLLQYFEIKYSPEELFTLVQESEQFAHGNPSGIDATAVVYEGVLQFQKKDGLFHSSQIETRAFDDKDFFLIQSGKPKESTKEMVQRVQKLIDEQPAKKDVLKKIGKVSEQVIDDLKQNTFEPQLMTENQKLLEELEVVGAIAKNMIAKITTIGGYAKVTGGAGYQKGSGMLWAYHPEPAQLEKLIQDETWKFYKTRLGIKK